MLLSDGDRVFLWCIRIRIQAGELPQWSRALVLLAKDPVLLPAPTWRLTASTLGTDVHKHTHKIIN